LHFVPMTNEDLNATTCRTPYRRCCMVSSPPQCYKGHGMVPHALAFVDLSPVYHLNGCYSCLQCGCQDWIWRGVILISLWMPVVLEIVTEISDTLEQNRTLHMIHTKIHVRQCITPYFLIMITTIWHAVQHLPFFFFPLLMRKLK
jgi:hypothetical protein